MSGDAANDPGPALPPPSQSGAATGTLSATASAQQQLAAWRAQLANYEQHLKPEHPDVLRAKRMIADLEPKAAAEAASGTSAASAVASSPADLQRRDRLAQM